MASNFMNVTKGVLTGMAIGGAAGVALACNMRKPTKRVIKKKTAAAMDTMGSIMQSIADYAK